MSDKRVVDLWVALRETATASKGEALILAAFAEERRMERERIERVAKEAWRVHVEEDHGNVPASAIMEAIRAAGPAEGEVVRVKCSAPEGGYLFSPDCCAAFPEHAQNPASDGCCQHHPPPQGAPTASALQEPVPGFDAREWVALWRKTIAEHPGVPKDDGAMLAWFAGAIMRGYDEPRAADPAAAPEPLRDSRWCECGRVKLREVEERVDWNVDRRRHTRTGCGLIPSPPPTPQATAPEPLREAREALLLARTFVVGCGQEAWSTTAEDIAECREKIDKAVRALAAAPSAQPHTNPRVAPVRASGSQGQAANSQRLDPEPGNPPTPEDGEMWRLFAAMAALAEYQVEEIVEQAVAPGADADDLARADKARADMRAARALLARRPHGR